MTNAKTKGPLDGIHVLEIAHFIAGPHAAMILCDHGADVIKIEPPTGEHARNAVAVDQYGNSLFFAAQNRGKRAVALDLGHADAKKVLDPLLKWADVIITNYGPGVPDKLGFGFARLQELNPKAILVHITGYGSWSDKNKYVAFDGIIQAMSGVWNLNGHPDGPPLNCQVLVGDHGTAAHAANAALCALVERGRTGKGQFIEVGMLEVLSSMLNSLVPDYDVNGEIPRRYGQRPFDRFGGSFKAKDAYFTVAPATPKMWKDLCNLMGHPEWADPSVGRRPGYIADPELAQAGRQNRRGMGCPAHGGGGGRHLPEARHSKRGGPHHGAHLRGGRQQPEFARVHQGEAAEQSKTGDGPGPLVPLPRRDHGDQVGSGAQPGHVRGAGRARPFIRRARRIGVVGRAGAAVHGADDKRRGSRLTFLPADPCTSSSSRTS